MQRTLPLHNSKENPAMKKRRISSLAPILVFLGGLSLLLYPTISNYWNVRHQSHVIDSYVQQVEDMGEEKKQEMWQQAQQFNADLLKRPNPFEPSDAELERYDQLLDLTGNGAMGYIEIPAIDCKLPVYHGTPDKVLQVAVGHIEWSSLPVGGESTHAVLSGHRGLTSARLFSNLDKLNEGDRFMLHVLDETLTYEVDQSRIVEPEDTTDLQIKKGMDLCTLVTCTPYGINTHRLLVRGHRVPNDAAVSAKYVTSDAVRFNSKLFAVFIGIPILIIILALMNAAKRIPR